MDVGAGVTEQDAKLSLLFAYLFHLACFICLIYALHVKDKVQLVSGLLYAGSAIGAVFAGDFITLFIFWELLALTSAFLVFARRTEAAKAAGIRYLMVVFSCFWYQSCFPFHALMAHRCLP
jgi:multicomponent Na+:H+ antiporter subunit D